VSAADEMGETLATDDRTDNAAALVSTCKAAWQEEEA